MVPLARALLLGSLISFALGCGLDQEGGGLTDGPPSAVDSGVGGQGPGGSGGNAGAGGDGATAGSGGSLGTCPAGAACVPAVPPGWSGYARILTEDASAASPGPDCPDGATPSAYNFMAGGGTACSPCTCGELVSASCGPARLFCTTSNGSCDGATDWTDQMKDGCDGAGSPYTLSCRVEPAPLLAAGSCAPSSSAPVGGPLFESVVHVCRQSASGSCGGGACAEDGVSPYLGSACIERPGEHACPGEWPVQQIVYAGANDTRSCTPCACGAPNTTCAGAEYAFYNGPDCWWGEKSVTEPQCKNLSVTVLGNLSKRRLSVAQPMGACPPSGGQPIGQVQPQGPITFCCRL